MAQGSAQVLEVARHPRRHLARVQAPQQTYVRPTTPGIRILSGVSYLFTPRTAQAETPWALFAASGFENRRWPSLQAGELCV